MQGGYLFYKHLTPNGVITSFVFAPEERNDCRKTNPNPKSVLSRSTMFLYSYSIFIKQSFDLITEVKRRLVF
jgi:hypothetical protein